MTTKNDLNLYDRLSHTWWDKEGIFHELIDFNVLRLEYYQEATQGFSGKRILDLGCGGGLLSEALCRQGADVVGLDQSKASIREADKHAQQEGLTIDYHAGVGENLPFDNTNFDVVIASQVLEHVDDRLQTMQEVARILKPGGLFVFDLPSQTWLARFLLITMGEYVTRMIPRGTHDGQLFVAPDQLTKELAGVNVSVKNIRGFFYWGKNFKGRHKFGFTKTTAFAYFGYGVKES